jgi:hypothetical protein
MKAAVRECDRIESDGSSTFAYRLSIGTVYGEDYEAPLNAFLAGRESALAIDVLKEVRQAGLAIRQEKQAFPDLSPDLSPDLRGLTLADFTTGWEQASPFRGTMVIRDLYLRSTRRRR